jgi:hypothetical protein
MLQHTFETVICTKGFFCFQNPLVVNNINAVLAVSHALGTVRRELCPGKLHCFHICVCMYLLVGFCSGP